MILVGGLQTRFQKPARDAQQVLLYRSNIRYNQTEATVGPSKMTKCQKVSAEVNKKMATYLKILRQRMQTTRSKGEELEEGLKPCGDEYEGFIESDNNSNREMTYA